MKDSCDYNCACIQEAVAIIKFYFARPTTVARVPSRSIRKCSQKSLRQQRFEMLFWASQLTSHSKLTLQLIIQKIFTSSTWIATHMPYAFCERIYRDRLFVNIIDAIYVQKLLFVLCTFFSSLRTIFRSWFHSKNRKLESRHYQVNWLILWLEHG